ncbi:MAG: Hpt domain-containing protein [Gammaproteobacteria bacterium]|nr:Hpt domain-containing protein [Gammaproteobacteria bacterium]
MEVHNIELALKRAAGRADLAAELHQMLVKSSSEIKGLMEQSWHSGDHESLLTHVHKLNGSTRYCGVPELESCAEKLEILLKAGEKELGRGYQALIDAIERMIQQPIQFKG